MEGFPQNIESEQKLEAEEIPARSNEELRFYNVMQIALIERYAGRNNMEAREVLRDWLAKYSKKFGEVFKKALKEDPELMKKYEENPESVLSGLEKLME